LITHSTTPQQLLDKQAVRRSFDRSAPHYDHSAVLQHEIAKRLLERLDYIRLQPHRILDLGCGTGRETKALAQRYPCASTIGIDFSSAMLKCAQQQASSIPKIEWICADIEQVPLADDCVDLIISNATLQWANDIGSTFHEWWRILRPGGLLLLTTFGPDTLMELRQAWHQVDADYGAYHVSPFVDMHHLGDALLTVGFTDPVMDMEQFTLLYSNVRALMQDLKMLGAQNRLTARRRGLTTRSRIQAVEQAYPRSTNQDDDRLAATWEVIYGHAWKLTTQPVRHCCSISTKKRLD
jgi:malonyl-CoA O-methyltransferase